MVAHSTYETTQSVLYYWGNVFRHNKFGKMLHVCGVVDVVPGKRSHILSTQGNYCKTSDHDTDCTCICQDFYGCSSITLLGLVAGLYALYKLVTLIEVPNCFVIDSSLINKLNVVVHMCVMTVKPRFLG